MHRIGKLILGLVAVSAFGFGGKQAYAARTVFLDPNCGAWNWCAPSQGGQQNCDACCVLQEYSWGICFSTEEFEGTGCVCWLDPCPEC